MDNFINQVNTTIEHLKEELKGIRTGRANPSMVENLTVETYGGQTKLRLLELATILNEDSLTLSIMAYDPSTVEDISRAILKSPLGLNPQIQGIKILLRLPPLSQEQRDKMIKLLGQIIEHHKMSIRNHRDEARKIIRTQFEKKEITEDMKFRQEKDIDTQTQKFMETIETMRSKKEEELNTV